MCPFHDASRFFSVIELPHIKFNFTSIFFQITQRPPDKFQFQCCQNGPLRVPNPPEQPIILGQNVEFQALFWTEC